MSDVTVPEVLKLEFERRHKCCSDFDKDCKHVNNPLLCWIGGETITPTGIVYTPLSDGYCPLLRKP